VKALRVGGAVFRTCAEDPVVGERIRVRPDNRPVETKDKVRLYKIGVEEAVLYQPPLDD
jgi:hypothetical protein